MDPETYSSAFLGVFVLATLGWVLFGRFPGPGDGVSTMRYACGIGGISLASTASVIGISFFSGLGGFLDLAPQLQLLIAAMAGLSYGMLALGRSKDVGKGRGAAALGIIPIANLWLMFAAPSPDPSRPPYRPKNKLLRFLIGFSVLVVGTAAPRIL